MSLPAATVHGVRDCHGLNCLVWMDRPIGSMIRRYERGRPGELVHQGV